ncbi:NUMOD4 motif [Variovorax sp. PBS-H4]|uniref:NUMOD4 motif-containing HNH endonuclease n=1 Tax=Variovorax sp. PBS-H4 TaxID=434008 RepID=UPI001318C689|nr:NUMOD4 motif [Variovorax sp. PBS-H4]
MREIWKDVKGYEGLYRVSNLGRVLGVKRGKALSLNKKPGETPTVTLCSGGVYQTRSVATIVCEAFKGYKPDGAVPAHKDGDLTNNRTSNLFWASRDTWVADTHGRSPFPVSFELVSPQGLVVRSEGLLALCRENGLLPSGVSRLLSGKSLSHRGWTRPDSPPRWLARTQQRALAC